MNKGKLEITICAGTTCYVLGGSSYLLLKKKLPERIRNQVRIEGSTCMGVCRDEGGERRTPCLKIGKNLYSGLSLEEAADEIIRRVENNEE